jgi:hypothetical protein
VAQVRGGVEDDLALACRKADTTWNTLDESSVVHLRDEDVEVAGAPLLLSKVSGESAAAALACDLAPKVTAKMSSGRSLRWEPWRSLMLRINS